MEVADSIEPCAENHAAQNAAPALPFEFESLEPDVDEATVPVRIEFANRLLNRDHSSELEQGELLELEDESSSDVTENLDPDVAREVTILAGGRPIGLGVIVVIDDQLSVKITRLNS